ncbi:MAG: 6-phosphofructokinase 1 [Acidimicrobiales bacterium]|jgi:6-phosphofructokinase 1
MRCEVGALFSSRHACTEFLDPAVRQSARQTLDHAGIGGLVMIGGNGSLAGAMHLSDPAEASDWEAGVVGIPASIDNDIALTSLSIGVDTATRRRRHLRRHLPGVAHKRRW